MQATGGVLDPRYKSQSRVTFFDDSAAGELLPYVRRYYGKDNRNAIPSSMCSESA